MPTSTPHEAETPQASRPYQTLLWRLPRPPRQKRGVEPHAPAASAKHARHDKRDWGSALRGLAIVQSNYTCCFLSDTFLFDTFLVPFAIVRRCGDADGSSSKILVCWRYRVRGEKGEGRGGEGKMVFGRRAVCRRKRGTWLSHKGDFNMTRWKGFPFDLLQVSQGCEAFIAKEKKGWGFPFQDLIYGVTLKHRTGPNCGGWVCR